MLRFVCAAALAVASLIGAVQAQVTLTKIDGGPNYYGQFAYPLPDDNTFFPLGVWFESVTEQAQVDLDMDAGINLYVQLTADSNLDILEFNGLQALLQFDEWSTNQNAIDHPAVAGWVLWDEIDMADMPDSQKFSSLQARLDALPADGRFRYNNYGKGVMWWQPELNAKKFVNQYQQPTSNDIYWMTDTSVASFAQCGRTVLDGSRDCTYEEQHRAANYGLTVDRMRYLDGLTAARKPIWNFVEVCRPFTEEDSQGGRTIQPDEIKGAVWHSIIAGARGIIYFNHAFSGAFSAHCLRDTPYAAQRAAVKETNELIIQLAPVLNGWTADGYATATNDVRILTKYRANANKYFIFAGNKTNTPTTATFTVQPSTGTAKVIGEGRNIPIVGGQFSDSFADGNAIHIYRID